MSDTTTTPSAIHELVSELFSGEYQEILKNKSQRSCYYTGLSLTETPEEYIQSIYEAEGDPQYLEDRIEDNDFKNENEKEKLENKLKEIEKTTDAIYAHWHSETEKEEIVNQDLEAKIKIIGGIRSVIKIAQELGLISLCDYYEDYEMAKSEYSEGRDSFYGWAINGGGGRREFQKMYGDGNYMSFLEWFENETGVRLY